MWLAVATFTVWFLFTLCFVDRQGSQGMAESGTTSLRSPFSAMSSSSPTPAFHGSRHFSLADHFIKSLLYNQVPLTAFLNRRSLLAFFALFVGFTMVTFIHPFFALIRSRKSYEVSIQLAGALGLFFLASLGGSNLLRWIGAKKITFLSLALATGACYILSKEPDSASESSESQLIKIDGNEKLTQAIRYALFYSDSAIAGYSLICVSIALLTIASLEEVLSGTENKLLKTKFNEASNLHLFVESTYIVICLIQLMHVVGPVFGGLLNTLNGSMSMTCFEMS